jgi:predicted metal-dependent hydrolase
MQKTLIFNGQKIEFNLKKNRLAKRLRILIHSDGRLTVSAPRFVSQKYIRSFLEQKADWIISHLAKCAPAPEKKSISPIEYERAKILARKIIQEKIARFSKIYDLHPKKIFIRDQSTRWGSCSSRGNLSFNFRLIYLLDELADYLVVHEICHLREMNHSQKFWNLVARTIPDYKTKKAALRAAGRQLTR